MLHIKLLATGTLVREKNSFTHFYHEQAWGHVCHVTWTVFPQPKEALYEILFTTDSVAFEEMF